MLEFGAVFRPAMRAEIGGVTDKLGLVDRDLEILLFVGRKDQATVTQIADVLKAAKGRGASLGRVSLALSALYKRGLIEKRPHPDDQRQTLVTLSKRGKKLVAAVHQARERVYEQICASVHLTKQEEEALTEVYRRCIAAHETRPSKR